MWWNVTTRVTYPTIPYPFHTLIAEWTCKKEKVSNVQRSLVVTNKNWDVFYGICCTNHPSWLAQVWSDALDTRGRLGSEPCMQRFAVDEQWYRGYVQECREYGGIELMLIAAVKTKDTMD